MEMNVKEMIARQGNDRQGNDRRGNDRQGNDRQGNDRQANDRQANDCKEMMATNSQGAALHMRAGVGKIRTETDFLRAFWALSPVTPATRQCRSR